MLGSSEYIEIRDVLYIGWNFCSNSKVETKALKFNDRTSVDTESGACLGVARAPKNLSPVAHKIYVKGKNELI